MTRKMTKSALKEKYENPDYREETVVRSVLDGTVLDRYPGDIHIMPNGEKWLVK